MDPNVATFDLEDDDHLSICKTMSLPQGAVWGVRRGLPPRGHGESEAFEGGCGPQGGLSPTLERSEWVSPRALTAVRQGR